MHQSDPNPLIVYSTFIRQSNGTSLFAGTFVHQGNARVTAEKLLGGQISLWLFPPGSASHWGLKGPQVIARIISHPLEHALQELVGFEGASEVQP
jgi:hypothetical protein